MVDPRDLTIEQAKAWKSLVRAIKKCEAANVFWYQVLDSVHPLNGNVVESIEIHDGGDDLPSGAFDLSENLPFECVSMACGFADDCHHAILKD